MHYHQSLYWALAQASTSHFVCEGMRRQRRHSPQRNDSLHLDSLSFSNRSLTRQRSVCDVNINLTSPPPDHHTLRSVRRVMANSCMNGVDQSAPRATTRTMPATASVE